MQWEQSGSLADKKDFVAYDHSPEWGLIISGGYDGDRYFDTVENTIDSLNFDLLPDLPKEQYIGCLAIVDEDTLLQPEARPMALETMKLTSTGKKIVS